MSGARPDTWMPMFWGSYLKMTGHLTPAEHGAYMLLIAHYWTTGRALPDDDERLRRIVRMSASEWRKARTALSEFFEISDAVWRQKKIEKELTRANELSAKRSRAGLASSETKKQQKQGSDINTCSTGVATNDQTEGSTHGQQKGRYARAGLPLPIQKKEEGSVPRELRNSLGTGADAPNASQDQFVELNNQTIEDAFEIPLSMLSPSDGDWSKPLFRQGLGWLAKTLGKPPNSMRSVIGGWMKLTGQDHRAVFELLAQAQRQKIADPVAWVQANLKPKSQGKGHENSATSGFLAIAEAARGS